jgi:hypothetical protein
MRVRCYIFLCFIPVLGAGQDSIRREAVQLTQKQVDSIRNTTKRYWYKSPNVMDKSTRDLLIDINERSIRSEQKADMFYKRSDSLQKANALANKKSFEAVIELNKATAKNQKLLLENQTFNNSLLMLMCVLTVAWLIQKIIGTVRAIKKMKANGAENYS